jgi:hypothetical protein
VSSNKSFTLHTPPDHLKPGDSAQPGCKSLPVALVTPLSPTTHRLVRLAWTLVVLVAGLVVALSVAGPAPAATTPCGKKVLDDWWDNGRVDRLYPLHCYEEAIDGIPADIRDYSDAEQVISRALQAAVGGKLAPGGADPSPDDDAGTRDPGTPVPGGPSDPGSSDGGSATCPGAVRRPTGRTTRPARRTRSPDPLARRRSNQSVRGWPIG